MSVDKLRDKVRKMHALLGSDNPAESAAAHAKLVELLAKHKLTWNDLPDILAGKKDDTRWPDDDTGGDPPHADDRPPALDLIRHILQRHLHLTEHQLTALTLWIAHSFKYHRFSVTPRLAALSPVRGCGKTTVLNLIKALAFKAKKFDNTTPAVLYRLIDRDHACILIDEADNQDLPVTAALRAVINSGHHCDGTISRYLDGEEKVFSTFAPLALAAIGTLPLPILHRSITLRMERAPNAMLVRFSPKEIPRQRVDCETVYKETFDWMRQCQPNLDPPMPPELRNRAADNWRVLIAIADACSLEWGAAAREAAVALCAGQGGGSWRFTAQRHSRRVRPSPYRGSPRKFDPRRGIDRSAGRPVVRMARSPGQPDAAHDLDGSLSVHAGALRHPPANDLAAAPRDRR